MSANYVIPSGSDFQKFLATVHALTYYNLHVINLHVIPNPTILIPPQLSTKVTDEAKVAFNK